MSKGVERFRAATSHLNLDIQLHEHSTHTAQEAANAVGAPIGAIVKSLLFLASEQPILVLVSGPNRVDQSALSERLGVVLEKADANAVKEITGYSIGGVPPCGHAVVLRTVMDEDFFHHDQLWAAAGSATAVFAVSPDRLKEITNADVTRVT